MTDQPVDVGLSVLDTADALPDNLFEVLGIEEAPADEPKPEVVDEHEDDDEEDDSVEDVEASDAEATSEDETDDEDVSDSEQKDSDKDSLFEIEIGEDVYEVNLEELKYGYLRGEDYLKKVNEFDQSKTKWEQEVSQERAAFLSEIEDIRREFAVKSASFESIDWDYLKRTDPQEYVVKRAQYAEHIEQRGKLEQQRQALKKVEQKHQELAYHDYLTKQNELVRKLIPEWNDDKQRPELQKAIAAYGIEQGLSEDEIKSLSDARLLSLLNKARLYDEGQRKRKAVADKKVPKEVQTAIKPGVSQGQSAPSGKRVKVAAAKFKENGSLRNTAEYLDAIGFELPTH